MAQLGSATVEVGDFLRRDDTGVEGEVINVDDTSITIHQWNGDDYTASVTEFHYNSWDAKYEASGKSAPVLAPTVMDPTA